MTLRKRNEAAVGDRSTLSDGRRRRDTGRCASAQRRGQGRALFTSLSYSGWNCAASKVFARTPRHDQRPPHIDDELFVLDRATSIALLRHILCRSVVIRSSPDTDLGARATATE